ncbi:hypothetical protein CKO08_10620 [Halorhodospira halochloris]|nr:hypothetical protein [Halorhodospira halochloris]
MASATKTCDSKVIATRNFFRLPRINKQLLPFLKPYRYYAVVRDPRAQFHSLLSQGRVANAMDFIKLYKAAIYAYHKNIRIGHIENSSTRKITFEDFVLSHRLRDSLLEDLGIDKHTVEPKNFIASESARNIDMFKTALNLDDIWKIEKELSAYIYSGCA